jgi:hypothetical protein
MKILGLGTEYISVGLSERCFFSVCSVRLTYTKNGLLLETLMRFVFVYKYFRYFGRNREELRVSFGKYRQFLYYVRVPSCKVYVM